MQGHLSWTRLLWISWEDLLPARAVLTLAMSSCACLCPAGIPQVAWGSVEEAANAAYQWQKNLTAILFTGKLMCLVPGSSNANVATFSKAGTWAISWGTREPRSMRGSCLPWGMQSYVEAEEKCIFLSAQSHMFFLWQRGLGE